MAGLEDRYTRKPAGRSLPTTAAHRRRNGTDEKKPPVGGCPPCVFGLPNPVASFFATIQNSLNIDPTSRRFSLITALFVE